MILFEIHRQLWKHYKQDYTAVINILLTNLCILEKLFQDQMHIGDKKC